MPIFDHYGNEITTKLQAARDGYDKGVHLFLGADYGAVDAFQSAVLADPGFALGHAGLARALMMQGQMAEAKSAIATAENLGRAATRRERDHIATLAALLAGKPAQARAAVRTHVRDHPRDALLAQLCTNVFGLIGFSGEVGREAELLAYTAELLPHYGDDWWMNSMHALSLCETGQIAASQALMETSLAINPRNANGAHFKAHAHYEAGETSAGRQYLNDWMAGYDNRAVLHGHLSWHAALWALQQGDETAMWDAVDRRIAPGTSHSLPLNVLTDTVAILYRAQLAGIEVAPDRWRAISAYAAQYFPETGQGFADCHAALGHAMAGQGDRLAYIADTAKGFAGDLIRPLARGWGHMARGHWAEALNELTQVMATHERIGGSRAQRDLLELAFVNCQLKLGNTAAARRTLVTRRPVLAEAPPLAGYA